MEQVKDNLPYYKECDACVNGGNYQPFWHPYPQSKPPRSFEEYLVTCIDDGDTSVDISAYAGIVEDRFLAVSNVVAWAELPQPYRV